MSVELAKATRAGLIAAVPSSVDLLEKQKSTGIRSAMSHLPWIRELRSRCNCSQTVYTSWVGGRVLIHPVIGARQICGFVA